MKTLPQVMKALKSKGKENTRKIFAKHGADGDFYGVSVADLKVIAKKIKGNQNLALELFDCGNLDAIYLAGLVADGSQMTKPQLNGWAKKASWQMISEYTVPWVAVEHEDAVQLAWDWTESSKESVITTGWCTYAGIVAVTPDDELDLDEIVQLLDYVQDNIVDSDDRVRYTMNGFVIAVGGYVKPLLARAKEVAKANGLVKVDMNGTACKVPHAPEYIAKMEKMGRVGKKRKTIRC